MGAYLLLALAIAAEVSATVSLKLSEGFSKAGPSIIVVVGYAIAFVALARVLKMGLAVGVAYAIWAAAGVALVAIIGVVFLKEPINAAMIAGLALVIGGVVLIELGSAST
ncbi:SMR family transporter [Amycolatopsis sp. NPDC048633]|uniref:DMT family transporter n=1 Tax=Amycolatopsis sp. NPDC048633 TaxID=3157095 RepID=UPI00340D5BA9